jgi:DMSO/TMAO reductase YedYZ molybdopterin-dependent catalytic subunit
MALFDSINQLNAERRRTTRRRFLFGGIAAIFSYFSYRWYYFRARPIANRTTKFLTPNHEFYAVSIDEGFRPNVKQDEWRLEIAGQNNVTLSYNELLKLPSQTIHKTFVCVGNEPGGPAMGNAVWTATALAPILEKALGTMPRENLRVVFHALDGFYSSVPLALALSSLSWLAYQMNGEPLPPKHGFPARVLLPGIYGMKQPRWLSKIEIVKTPWFKGYWEARGYCDECKIKMTARIDSARPQSDGSWLVTGVALCGTETVGTVEVSFDDGDTWQAATITSETLPDAWVTWQAVWKPENKGEYVLSARVVEASGKRQIERNSTSFPSGSTGLHRAIVSV